MPSPDPNSRETITYCCEISGELEETIAEGENEYLLEHFAKAQEHYVSAGRLINEMIRVLAKLDEARTSTSTDA